LGVVLDPIQFAAELASLKQRPKYQGRALYVRLPDAVVRLFESPLVPIQRSLTVLGGQSLPVAVLTLQAAGTQVLCLVPLASDEARDWLVQSVEEECIYVAVTVEESQQLVLMQAQRPVPDLRNPTWLAVKERLSASRSRNPAEGAADFLDVLRYVDEALQSEVEGFQVQDRWIVVCVPHHEESLAAAAASGKSGGAGRRAVH
jgi:hypothetical protein